MNVIAINGSPRKNRNTAVLLEKAMEGVHAAGGAAECTHLYDLNFKGCLSCFACKRKGGKSYGACAYLDDLAPVLESISQADALLLASPIYFMSVTSGMQAFLERLLFPYITYTENYQSLFPKKIPVGCIYTMNLTEEQMPLWGLPQTLQTQERFLTAAFGPVESITVHDTYQFDDYTKYVAPVFDEAQKAKQRAEQFPKDCERAFALGEKLVTLSQNHLEK